MVEFAMIWLFRHHFFKTISDIISAFGSLEHSRLGFSEYQGMPVIAAGSY